MRDESQAQMSAMFRRLATLYARAMDRNEPEILDRICTDDVVVEGPGFRASGLAQVRAYPAQLEQMFLKTQHVVHNQVFDVQGDEATGETYSTASHLIAPDAANESHSLLVWAIRYQDQLRRSGETWRFSKRALVVDWSETRPVSPSV